MSQSHPGLTLVFRKCLTSQRKCRPLIDTADGLCVYSVSRMWRQRDDYRRRSRKEAEMNLIELTAIVVGLGVFLFAVVDLVFPSGRRIKGLFKV